MECSTFEAFQFDAGRRDPFDELCPAVVSGKGLLVLSAHPDDEVIGAGGQILHWGEAGFAHVTDGASRDMLDASRQGFEERESYSLARRRELESAMSLAGISSLQIQELGFVAQESWMQLPQLVGRCVELLRSLRPVAILTHSYEGGHPDHDSSAFAVQTACKILKQSGEPYPAILEMTSYRTEAGSMQMRQFLFSATHRPITCMLDPQQRAIKKQMFDCLQTQRSVLQWFPIDFECFRVAPDYDFLRPPHEGVLYYELFNWGTTGAKWRAAVAETLATLGLPDRLRSGDGPAEETWWRMAG